MQVGRRQEGEGSGVTGNQKLADVGNVTKKKNTDCWKRSAGVSELLPQGSRF